MWWPRRAALRRPSSALGHQGLPVPRHGRQRCGRPIWLHRRGNRAVLRIAQWRAGACACRPLHAEEGRQCRGLYECGAHWPRDQGARLALVREGLATRKSTTTVPASTPACWRWPATSVSIPAAICTPDHPVQRAIASTWAQSATAISSSNPGASTDARSPPGPCRCSNMALGFAQTFARVRQRRRATHYRGGAAHPFMVAGT